MRRRFESHPRENSTVTLPPDTDLEMAERVARIEAVGHERDQAVRDRLDEIKDRRIEIIERIDQRIDDERMRLEAVVFRIDQRFDAGQHGIAAALASVDRAQDKFEDQAKALQLASNEWRSAMNDREKTFPTRTEVDTRIAALDEKMNAGVKAINDKVDTLATTQAASIQYIERKMTEGFESLRLSRAETIGGAKRIDDLRVWLGVGIALIIAAVTIAAFVLSASGK